MFYIKMGNQNYLQLIYMIKVLRHKKMDKIRIIMDVNQLINILKAIKIITKRTKNRSKNKNIFMITMINLLILIACNQDKTFKCQALEPIKN